MKPIQKILPLAVLILLSACSPSARIARILERHPELTLSDTLLIRDTIPLPSMEADTLLQLEAMKDTVFLRNDRLDIALSSNLKTLYVKGKCKADTIYRTHRVTVEKIRIMKPNRLDALIAKIPWLVVGLIAILALTGLVVYRKKLKSLFI